MSIHPDESRPGTWKVRWREEGRQRTKRGFASDEDAREFDVLKRREIRLGAHGVAEPSATRLRVWLETWWERYSVGWERGTQLERGPIIRKWIVPYLGEVRLRDLGEARLRAWRAQIRRDGCSANRANATMRVLSSALTAAVRERLIPSNPIIGEHRIERLPHRVERPRVLLPVEVEAIRVELSGRRDRLVVSLGAYAGLRPEEITALRWASLGDTAATIDEAYTAGEVKGTKTGGRRVVPLIGLLADELAAWRVVYEEETGRAREPASLVVPSDRAGDRSDHLNWNWWRKELWHPARERAVFDADGTRVAPATPYDLRHSYASLLIHEGRPVTVVAAWMGHADAKTTLAHYAHLIDTAQLSSNTLMVDAIEDARTRLYKVKRGQKVATGPVTEAEWDEWRSLMWPGVSGESGRRGSNPRPQAWESPESVYQESAPVPFPERTGENRPDADSEDLGPEGTPNVAKEWPEPGRERARQELVGAAKLARAVNVGYPLDGAPDHTVAAHEAMARGELVPAHEALGIPHLDPATRGAGGTRSVQARPTPQDRRARERRCAPDTRARTAHDEARRWWRAATTERTPR